MRTSQPNTNFDWVKNAKEDIITLDCKYLYQSPYTFLVEHQGSRFWVNKSELLKQTANSITIKTSRLQRLIK